MHRLLALLSALLLATPAAAQNIPHLERRGEATQLIVDGQPFLILGGELGNSSSSSRDYMRERWSKLQAMHLNTVLAPVTWELIEPEEGKFDFSSVDWLLEDARAHDLRLVLLWFGTWKNSTSSYAPAWVKRDSRRFVRTPGAGGVQQEILSVFDRDTREADARAFAALMRHLKQADGAQHTVLMVQVENEIGFLPHARETSQTAEQYFAEPVPAALDPRGSPWREAFGDEADERFQAWRYARFADAVAAAGKREYPLPLYVNGAQGRPGVAPGDYPSGGPLAHLAKEWRAGAPSIDFIAPDIYFANFAEIADRYVASGNPLFIPEANRPSDPRIAANALRSIGQLEAIGFSPFAIEDAGEVDAARIGGLYAMLESIAPLVLKAQAEGRIAGFGNPVTFAGQADLAPMTATLGSARFAVTTIDPWTAREAQDSTSHGALLIWLGGEDYLFAGQGATLTVEPADGLGRLGFDRVDEGRYENGQWLPGRRLNGDQTHQGRHVRLPPGAFGVQEFRLYRY
jgi:beta-galactosidase GanA